MMAAHGANCALQARACGNYRAVAVAAARTWLPSRGGEIETPVRGGRWLEMRLQLLRQDCKQTKVVEFLPHRIRFSTETFDICIFVSSLFNLAKNIGNVYGNSRFSELLLQFEFFVLFIMRDCDHH